MLATGDKVDQEDDMYAEDGRLVTSASDLTAASRCEFAFLRTLDGKRGRLTDPGFAADALLARAAGLGDSTRPSGLRGTRPSSGTVS